MKTQTPSQQIRIPRILFSISDFRFPHFSLFAFPQTAPTDQPYPVASAHFIPNPQ
jgi:hypothetical protein